MELIFYHFWGLDYCSHNLDDCLRMKDTLLLLLTFECHEPLCFTIEFLYLQVKLEGLLPQSPTLWLLLSYASCGQCSLHWACQIYDIVRLAALEILS